MGNMRFKVGDRVRIKSIDWYNENKDEYGSVYAGCGFVFWKYMAGLCGEIMTIFSVKVDPENPNKGYYFMEDSEERWTDEMIEGLVEEEVDLIPKFGEFSDNEPLDIPTMTIDFIKEHGLPCPEGYIFKDENGNVINTMKIVLAKKKREYPKTYEECCKILMGKTDFQDFELVLTKLSINRSEENSISPEPPYISLINTFYKLLICRDAYWKIVGDEMGLGKPWKPDWEGEGWYVIVNHRGDVVTDIQWHANAILAFPTEEMRDAFYENFKTEIESCKELL